MALLGDSLFVTDIDAVRVFDRETGAPIADVIVPDAVFLNDVASAEDGTIYVTDTWGDAVYVITADLAVDRLAEGAHLGNPNGIAMGAGRLFIASASSDRVYELGADGLPGVSHTLPAGGLDGLVLLDDGSMLVSSWDGGAVYRIGIEGDATEVFGGITAPADIGFDAKRGRVLIPHFRHDRVEARSLPR
jgi:sugar lactone lactonase YvrE